MVYLLEKQIFIEQSTPWIDYGLVFASILSAIIALVAVCFQANKNRKDREPILSPQVKKQFLKDVSLSKGWDKEDYLESRWSNTSITLANYGAIAIIDIEYNYRIKDIEDLKSHIQTLNEDHKPDKEITNVPLISPSITSDKVQVEFLILKENALKQMLILHQDKLKADALRPNEETNLLLPSYFIAIHNYFLELKYANSENHFISSSYAIELEIVCTDAEKRNWKFLFDVFIEPIKITTSNHKISGQLNISFRYLKRKKLRNFFA